MPNSFLMSHPDPFAKGLMFLLYFGLSPGAYLYGYTLIHIIVEWWNDYSFTVDWSWNDKCKGEGPKLEESP